MRGAGDSLAAGARDDDEATGTTDPDPPTGISTFTFGLNDQQLIRSEGSTLLFPGEPPAPPGPSPPSPPPAAPEPWQPLLPLMEAAVAEAAEAADREIAEMAAAIEGELEQALRDLAEDAAFAAEHAAAVAAGEEEPLDFWDAHQGWADAESATNVCIVTACSSVFASRGEGQWVARAESPGRPLGRMCVRCWPMWDARPWPWTLCVPCAPPHPDLLHLWDATDV